MKQIWKYVLDINGAIVNVPDGGQVVYVDSQRDNVCVWIEVDLERTLDQIYETRCFELYGTGQPIPGEDTTYLGTAKLRDGTLILHVYERC